MRNNLKGFLRGIGTGLCGLTLLAVVDCSSTKVPVTPQCILTSDCRKADPSSTMVCLQPYCVVQCNTSADCPNGQRCVQADATGPADGGALDASSLDADSSDAGVVVISGPSCQPPDLATCNYNSQCRTPLVCANDHQCRNECMTDADCPGGLLGGQKCTSMTHLCADPLVDRNYDPGTNEFTSLPGTGGAGGNAGGSGGSGGGIVPSCATAQTQFGYLAQGDANANFTSGVGVRSGNQFFVFSGYSGPDPTGAGGAGGGPGSNVNWIYVQAFDATTGVSAAPAVPFIHAADGLSFAVDDAAVAPTGEMVLLHSSGTATSGTPTQLYASFLSVTAGTAGAAAVKLMGIPQPIESVQFGEPHVVWSAASKAFIASWKFATSAWFTRVKGFSTTGVGAGLNLNVVPTAYGSNNDSGWDDGHIGTSGNLFGVAYRDAATGYPALTVLDASGAQVGDFLRLSGIGVSHWVATGGTTQGFVGLFNNGSTAYGVYVPSSGATGVLDGGASTLEDGGTDGSAVSVFGTFSFPTTATTAQMISDDTGGAGGVAAVMLETNGASFLYVTADGTTHTATGTVLTSPSGTEVAISNYHGSFAVSLYDGALHATQMKASGCSP